MYNLYVYIIECDQSESFGLAAPELLNAEVYWIYIICYLFIYLLL